LTARLKAEFWVKALLRRCAAADAPAVVVRRGDADAGAVLVKVNRLDGSACVYAPGWGLEGERIWRRGTGPAPAPDAEAEAYIARQTRRDPDLWVVEIEDRAGRHFLTEPVE
jgi:hypothetical protein